MGLRNNQFGIKLLQLTMVALLLTAMPALASQEDSVNQKVAISHIEKSASFNVKQDASVSSSCTAYFKGTLSVNDCRVGEVPLPAAIWLFILALLAFVGLSNKRKI